MHPNDTLEKIRLLSKKYAQQLPDKISQIETVFNNLCNENQPDKNLKELLRMVHTLSGSASSFGFSALGSSARILENLLKGIIAEGITITDKAQTKIRACIEDLKQKTDIQGKTSGRESHTEDLSSTLAASHSHPAYDKKLIYICDDDHMLLNNLSLQISHFGYDVKTFTEPAGLTQATKETIPSAIIMDMMFSNSKTTGSETVSEIKQRINEPLPVIFMSGSSSLDVRLSAARAGGDAYFIKPINISVLIDKLDTLASDKVLSAPYRILIVDDDPELANYYSLILTHADMATTIITKPLEVMTSLIEFNPDLILMDMYMPDCNGIELAKVIRQIESFVSIPIVFLSAETNLDKQLTAMSMGGDDFLTKPIKPDHLISSVKTRAERMRIIRAFMDRDSLTGLLNHTRTKENLDISLDRAKRQNTSLSFAMIDIDRFKSVNDTYGHPTGDRVILSLSRLLQQRLRKTDIIGRYGGEEFAVILNDTSEQTAIKVMDEIRLSFSQIKHQSGKKDFYVTFSCGIAAFPFFADATNLCNASDKALYEAKHSGRNQVVLTDQS